MELPLRSMEQLMPFATAGELIAKKRQPVVSVEPDLTVFAALTRMQQMHVGLVKDIFVVTLIKTAAVFLVIGVFQLTGLY